MQGTMYFMLTLPKKLIGLEIGMTYGRLTIASTVYETETKSLVINYRHKWMVDCTCSCGVKLAVYAIRLVEHTICSCGCNRFQEGIPDKIKSLKPGDRFERLLVQSVPFNTPGTSKHSLYRKRWSVHCLCDCGTELDVMAIPLVEGSVRSCDCLRNELAAARATKHGLIPRSRKYGKHPLYTVWACMRDRCNRKKNSGYHRYGGRGIRICEEWNDFQVFFYWATTNGWQEGLTIDRRDNDGNYEPSNCRFTTYTIQANNKSTNVHITYEQQTHTIAEWSRDPRCKVTYFTLYERLQKGIPLDIAWKL
jgi:hypothetical protein